MLGKAREALSDVAQTIRRIFGEPRVGTLAAPAFGVRSQGDVLLRGLVLEGLAPLRGQVQAADLLGSDPQVGSPEPFAGVLREERGWAAWASEARALEANLFAAGRAAQLAVPALPKGTRVQAPREPLPRPEGRTLPLDLNRPRAFTLEAGRGLEARARTDLARALARPFVFQGEDLAALPKALWMRYSLALVKATGENVRNLEVVGLYRLPRRGVSDLRPDGEGRLWVRLTPEAVGAKRAPFMLARRKDDQAYVSACVDES